jgi:hypothetical protein
MKFVSVFADNERVVNTTKAQTDFCSSLLHFAFFVDIIGIFTFHFFAFSIARS